VLIDDINSFIGANNETNSQSGANSNNNMEIVGDELGYASEGGAESIHPLLDGEGYYDSDNDSISSSFTDPVGVYMAGDVNTALNPILQTLLIADNAVARATELEQA
jgi:hypothetical protein